MNDQRATDWVEALMIRLYNSNRFRRHFPVILETSYVYYFNFEIFNKLNLYILEFLNLNFDGFSRNSKLGALSKIYNADQIDVLGDTFGSSVYHTHIFSEIALRSDQKFIDLIKKSK